MNHFKKHRVSIRKFSVLYVMILVLITALAVIFLNVYVKYVLDIVDSISRNAVMINDGFALKQALSPLVTAEISSISILNSNNQTVFFHNQAESYSSFLFQIQHEVLDKGALLYSIHMKIDLFKFTLILFALAVSLLFLYIPFAKYEQKEMKNKSNELLASLSKKLAHDIRTPLSTLNLISSKMPDLEIRSLQQAVVKQIDLIAEDLLTNGKNPLNQKSNSQPSENSFYDFFELIEGEFRIKSDNMSNTITFDMSSELKTIKIVHSKQLYPIICNCLNNAIEAIDKQDAQIRLAARIISTNLVIEIKDNGRGITKEILSKLGHQQITSGKNNSTKSGNGIALYNAKKDIMAIGGSFTIESELGRSTHVHIRIPLS